MSNQAVHPYGYHDNQAVVDLGINFGGIWTQTQETGFTYSFNNFFHPFVGKLIAKLNTDELVGVMDPVWQKNLEQQFFVAAYKPSETNLCSVAYWPKSIEVLEAAPYANYNWEMFYHIPITIAVHLSKTRRFIEAQRWFHFIFDPTAHDASVAPPKRFWNFLAFRMDDDPKQIDYLLYLLSQPPEALSSPDYDAQQDILNGYHAMLDKPFQPHAIARTRHVAYQYYVVMKYLDNLIAWGDDLFQAYTIETINEATLLYILASNILGPRPQQVPSLGTVQAKTFADLKKAGLDAMGNALVELEAAFPFNITSTGSGTSDGSGAGALWGIGQTIYFCVPKNQKLLAYWDTVADRLFKIRHCMNIQGIVQPLPLYDPPIDPGMLIAATAAGIDISSIVSGLNQPIGPVRSVTQIQKTLEICSEVKSLGAALLSALEKGDSEHLTLIRQRQEIQIQQLTQEVRFLQWKSAEEATQSLLTTRGTALERFKYYQRLLGLPADPNAPDQVTLSRPDLTEENFASVYQTLVGQYDVAISLENFPTLRIAGTSSPSQQSGASGQGNLYLNTNEDADLNIHGPNARADRLDAMHSDAVTGVLALIPDFGIDLHFWGLGGHANVFGGSFLASAGRLYSSLKNISAAVEEGQGVNATKTSTFSRRADDWLLQYNLAAHELMQNGRSILTSLLSEQTTKHEYDNVVQQIANANEINDFLLSKFTGEQLYLWMQGETSQLYYNYYRFAFDTARKTEQTIKRELMRPELDSQTFVQFNYWDTGHQGLLAGEALHLDVKRMEQAYYDNNKRELELTCHISLRQLNPIALLQLKFTGTCTFAVPEWYFDKLCPGHFMRRIKTAALSIPSVVGPYTTVHCTLSLLNSSIRTSPILADGDYARQGTDDNRFSDYAGAAQSIVTSNGSNDSGLFETNLKDERFLPFEGAGAVSNWQLDLPTAYPGFDYATISDVILHMKYTARPGLPVVTVNKALNDLFTSTAGIQFALLFSLPHDFPTEWSAFINGTGNFSVIIKQDYFPYFAQGKTITLLDFQLYGTNLKHHTFDIPADRTVDLQGSQLFTLNAPADPAGPTQVLLRQSGKEIFLVILYSVG